MPENLRYEIKIAYDANQLYEARRWVRLHSYAFRTAYPPRQINNVYFDTLNMDSFNDHLSGASQRRKLRYRWYGPDLEHARGQLEIKEKQERIGWKEVQPAPVDLNLQTMDWRQIQNALLSQASGRFHLMLAAARPVLINSYQREYYLSSDGYIRLTLDYRLHAYDQAFGLRPNLTCRTPLYDQIIIEFKSNQPYSRQLADALAEFPLRANRFSKYVGSLDAMPEW